MADTLTTITNLINSPPGRLVAGGMLAGIVWKFFEKVEEKLNDDTKLEIAVWLLDRKPMGPRVVYWPEALLSFFQRLFAASSNDGRFALRSLTFCISAYALTVLTYIGQNGYRALLSLLPSTSPWVNALFAVYVSVLPVVIGPLGLTIMGEIIQTHDDGSTKRALSYLVYVLVVALAFSIWTVDAAYVITTHYITADVRSLPAMSDVLHIWRGELSQAHKDTFIIASVGVLSPDLWLILLIAAGAFLSMCRRFDIGFQWFNRRFDIEKKPLSSIGLVSGVLEALIHWAAVLVRWMVFT